jgi:hypothetical protein
MIPEAPWKMGDSACECRFLAIYSLSAPRLYWNGIFHSVPGCFAASVGVVVLSTIFVMPHAFAGARIKA